MPLYEHDCDRCQSLGEHRVGDVAADLYFCTQGGNIHTVVARYSDDGPDYSSGLEFMHNPFLREAETRARAQGFLQPIANEEE